MSRRWSPAAAIALTILFCALAPSHAENSRASIKEPDVDLSLAEPSPIEKRCCGYPIAEELGFALRFYWLAMEDRFVTEKADTDIYTPEGYLLGVFPARFVRALRMEGSGLLADGRVVNYAGRCKYGTGTCFRELDRRRYPFGRGAARRTLIPFKSVAVDPRLIALGEPLYIPEFDGLQLPNGSIHDGCVRADDTGGNIKLRHMDFFVVRYENFRFLLNALYGKIFVTPHVESPHCQYLRTP